MLAIILIVILSIAAYGIPGEWVLRHVKTIEGLSCERVAFSCLDGLVLKKVSLKDTHQQTVLVHASRVAVNFKLRPSLSEMFEHITSLRIDGLYIRQLEYDDSAQEATLDNPEPFPDLSTIQLPVLKDVALELRHANVLDIRLHHTIATLNTTTNRALFRRIRAQCSEKNDEVVEGEVCVDLLAGNVDVQLHGTLFPDRIHGVYRALDFPTLEHFSSNFTLREPVWANCTISVGLNKYKDHFVFDIDLLSRKGGTYCGVPFDEMEGHIACRGVFTAVTTISPIKIKRKGQKDVIGMMAFDSVKDIFSFEVQSEALTPEECFKIIDMPFTAVIPKITPTRPPKLQLTGSLPFLREQFPEDIFLKGTIQSNAPLSIDTVQIKTLDTEMLMRDGELTFKNADVTFAQGGSLSGSVSLDIPHEAAYVNIHTLATLKSINLSDILPSTDVDDTIHHTVISGLVDLTCRTDDTIKASFAGEYDLDITGDLFFRLPVFAGLTSLVANNVPGISAFTDMTHITLDGNVQDGIFALPHFELASPLVIIEGPVTYNLPKDDVQAKVIAGFIKRDSLVGDLTRWLTVPMARLLLEIEVSGPIAKPQWAKASTLEKLWDGGKSTLGL